MPFQQRSQPRQIAALEPAARQQQHGTLKRGERHLQCFHCCAFGVVDIKHTVFFRDTFKTMWKRFETLHGAAGIFLRHA